MELGLDTLEKRREEQDMAFDHKMALGGQLGKVFEMADAQDRPRTRQTEGEYRLIQKFARTDPRKYSFAVRVVDPWNKLPEDLKLANSKEQKAGLWIRIRIGSVSNWKPGSGSGFGIRIRIQEGKNDPKK